MANMAGRLIIAAYCLRGQLVGLHGGFMMNGVIMLLSSTPKNWFHLLGKKITMVRILRVFRSTSTKSMTLIWLTSI